MSSKIAQYILNINCTDGQCNFIIDENNNENLEFVENNQYIQNIVEISEPIQVTINLTNFNSYTFNLPISKEILKKIIKKDSDINLLKHYEYLLNINMSSKIVGEVLELPDALTIMNSQEHFLYFRNVALQNIEIYKKMRIKSIKLEDSESMFVQYLLDTVTFLSYLIKNDILETYKEIFDNYMMLRKQNNNSKLKCYIITEIKNYMTNNVNIITELSNGTHVKKTLKNNIAFEPLTINHKNLSVCNNLLDIIPLNNEITAPKLYHISDFRNILNSSLLLYTQSIKKEVYDVTIDELHRLKEFAILDSEDYVVDDVQKIIMNMKSKKISKISIDAHEILKLIYEYDIFSTSGYYDKLDELEDSVYHLSEYIEENIKYIKKETKHINCAYPFESKKNERLVFFIDMFKIYNEVSREDTITGFDDIDDVSVDIICGNEKNFVMHKTDTKWGSKQCCSELKKYINCKYNYSDIFDIKMCATTCRCIDGDIRDNSSRLSCNFFHCDCYTLPERATVLSRGTSFDINDYFTNKEYIDELVAKTKKYEMKCSYDYKSVETLNKFICCGRD